MVPFSLSREGTNIHQSVDVAHTAVTGSFTLASLYGPLSVVISEIRKEKNELPQALVGTSYELLWAPSEENCFLRDAVMDSA